MHTTLQLFISSAKQTSFEFVFERLCVSFRVERMSNGIIVPRT